LGSAVFHRDCLRRDDRLLAKMSTMLELRE
jgi:hypothetical protein